MTTDRMVVWLRETMDAAQADAEAATWTEDAGTWRAAVSEYGTPARPHGPRWYIEDSMEDGVITTVDPQASADEGVARHIARHHPAAVLRRITADRKTLDDCDDVLHDFTFGAFRKLAEDTVRNMAEGWGWTGETPSGN